MSNIANFESRASIIADSIDKEVASIRNSDSIELPTRSSHLVSFYVNKIEGSYNVSRAKRDTDNVIDLLYIAYNTTPQDTGSVRNKIVGIMNKLLVAQQKSKFAMDEAIRASATILRDLEDTLVGWKDARDPSNTDIESRSKEVKLYITSGFDKTVKDIYTQAMAVSNSLCQVVSRYDDILKDTAVATAENEKNLGIKITHKAAHDKEMSQLNAQREKLDSMVKDLQEEVSKLDKKAREYETKANTAEERAFVMSLLQLGAKLISDAIPAIASGITGAATGGTSLIAGAVMSGAGKGGSGNAGGAEAAEQIELKRKISEADSKLKESQEKQIELNKRIKSLETKRETLLEAGGNDGDDSKSVKKDSTSGKDNAGAVDLTKIQVDELNASISKEKTELKSEVSKSAGLQNSISGWRTLLDDIGGGLRPITEEQQNQAVSLREMQMKMLDKVEAYEKEKRIQTAELVKINALLATASVDDNKIQLAIKSLNMSISAIKRAKEIIEEIAFFFKSFANFLMYVADEAKLQTNAMDSLAATEVIKKFALERIVKTIDEFFIKQAAEWHAVAHVADKFSNSFDEGWSMLNKLSGTYIHGEELTAYLQNAGAKITEIVSERDEASVRKLADLESYRNEVRVA